MTAAIDPTMATEHEDDLIVVERTMEPLYRQCYEALGWELLTTVVNPSDPTSVLCGFRRGVPTAHRHELYLLQRDCDRTLDTISQLRRLRDAQPGGAGLELAAGLVGVAFLVSAIAFAAIGLVTAILWVPVAVAGAAACALVAVRARRRSQAAWQLSGQLEHLRAATQAAALLRG